MISFLEFLHVTPLFIAMLVMIAPHAYRLFGVKRAVTIYTEPLLLLLCSIGIASGANTHGHIHHMVDPCFGYAMILVAVAAKIAYRYGSVKA